jgi:tetratricopeptide (TPR) repeat protein
LIVCGAARAEAQPPTLDVLERAITADPENLELAANYRQLAISTHRFDRSIDFLKRLANRKGSGPNIKISLALAFVDKVPIAGEIRRLYLGRDAINALTKSIEQQPTVLAFGVRGLINIYYNNFIFHRIPRGLEDFRNALGLVTPETPPLVVWRVYMSMGDGYWRLEQRDSAREVWRKGLALFPDNSELSRRIDGDDETVEKIVDDAVDPDTRVDTSLRGALP